MGTHSHAPDVLRIERPQHVVSIKRPLLVSQTPITQGLYAALMGVNPSYFPDWHAPVEQVSWKEAAEFCNHLSRLDGLEEVYEFKEESSLAEPEDDSQSEEDNDQSYFEHLKSLRKAKKEQESETTSNTAEEIDSSDSEATDSDLDKAESHETMTEEEDGESIDAQTSQKPKTQKTLSSTPEDQDPEEIESLQLSAEVEQDESLDERRREILNEGEKELEEKAKKRYQLEKVKEAPPKKLWVRCRLNCGGYRLPTEAEWEYVARAGSVSVFAGSKNWRDVAWGSSTGQEGTQAVAQLKPNDWGLYDMCGNVAEWCSDDQRAYTRNTVDPCYRLSKEWTLIDTRSIRGGGWRRPDIHARVSARARCSATQKRSHIGFRIVRPLLPVSPFESTTDDEVKT